jgi:SPP1 gp7 family putative phage head morphogenesis protein
MNKELEKEILKIKQLGEKLTEKEIMKLAKEYKKSLSEVRSMVLSIYTRYSIDDVLNMTSTEISNEMNKIDKVLFAEVRRMGLIEFALTSDLLRQIYQDSYYSTIFTIEKGIDIGINFNLLRPEFIEAAINIPIEGMMYSDRIWNNKALMMQRLKRDLKEAMEKGTSIEKLSRKLSKDIGSSLYESSRLLRTESARCQTMAQLEVYKNSGVINRLMWSATLDSKTNPVDASYDGRQWDIEDNSKPSIPLHPNCRCAWIPVIKGQSPTKRRDNETKEVVEYTSYEKWKKSKGI